MVPSEDLLICYTCGTQFDVPANKPLNACKICDDPRQYVPSGGQAWTSLRELQSKGHKTVRSVDSKDKRLTRFQTEPSFGIGQRCFLLQTDHGNVLWDCIAFLDEETISFIKAAGGLKAIVISHPHYYTTHMHWARAFDCPVYVAKDDKEWLAVPDPDDRRHLFENIEQEIVPGVTAIKLGGHFPGSLVLLWDKKLFVADTMQVTPSGIYHINRPPGTNSFAFMWSYPNMIPLPPSEMMTMWQRLKPFDFDTAHGAFAGKDIYGGDAKGRVLQSMKIQTRAQGHDDVAILREVWP